MMADDDAQTHSPRTLRWLAAEAAALCTDSKDATATCPCRYYNNTYFVAIRSHFLQQHIYLMPHVITVALYVRILPQRFTMLQFIASIATKVVLSATKQNCCNILNLLPRTGILWYYLILLQRKMAVEK
jgi:hypothetical protein